MSLKENLLNIEFNEDSDFEKIIKAVRGNEIFRKIIKDVKEEYFVDDKVHGITHNERVALIVCYIGMKYNLSQDDMKLLIYSALYHDIGRKEIPKGTRGIGRQHGFKSAEILKKEAAKLVPDLNEEEIKVIEALCIAHSVGDNEIEQELEKNKIKINAGIKQLINILKDADALDRVRLPHGRLDEKYLRTEEAKKMVGFSKELYKKYNSLLSKVEQNMQEEKVHRQEESNNNSSTEEIQLGNVLFDGENYYLIRALNEQDIRNIENRTGISPRNNDSGEYLLSDVLLHSTATNSNSKYKYISMTSDPNVALTYTKDGLNRFILIKLNKEDISTVKMFSAGDYLLEEMERKLQECLKDVPEEKKEIIQEIQDKFDLIEKAKTIEEIRKIINGADSLVSTSLIDTEQQYLNENERMIQARKIAKCKLLNRYGIMQNLEESLTSMGSIESYTGIMRVAYHNSEWLTSKPIEQERISDIPKMMLDALALIKQAEFQGKNIDDLKKLEQEVLKLILSREKIEDSQIEYSKVHKLRDELTIDKALEMTNGEISYRDTNMQIIAIRALSEMILNKRKIVSILQEKFPNINVNELL